MPSSLGKIYLHLIFSTKNREKIIDPKIEESLYKYIFVCLENSGSYPIIVGGYLDHIHILFCLHRTKSVSKTVEHIKSVSSKWMKRQGEKYMNFYWQKGYAIFSVDYRGLPKVKKYIQNQKQHHESKGFKVECRLFFEAYEIEYDEKYVWD